MEYQPHDPDMLADFLKRNHRSGYGWALYHLPGSDVINFIAGETSQGIGIQPGFVIAPFAETNGSRFYIQPKATAAFSAAGSMPLTDELPAWFNTETGLTTGYDDYCALVSTVLSEIESGTMIKAVPAKTRHVSLPDDFSIYQLYKNLLRNYSNAFVYLLSTPQTGTWIGCSPELLFRADNNNIETLSLAGTRKTNTENPDEFTGKELEEQDIVTRYIENILDKYCTDISIIGPVLQQAGNVQHLATRFKAVLKEPWSGDYDRIVADLHPTPAVCGLPLEAARKLLHACENFDRALYSGYLGPVSENKADLFVNLRCMQVYEHSAQLYAGAGVVKGSVPEKEWYETEDKMQTLGRFL